MFCLLRLTLILKRATETRGAHCLVLQHWQQCKRFCVPFSDFISYRSNLVLSFSIISVMERTPCPLVLMATSVMDPHCIATKSWLNNLPLLWLERLSQLFNDVSVLEGKKEYTFFFTYTHWLTTWALEDRQTDTHWCTTNEMRPSAAEQLNWLHEKETPKQPLLRQPWLLATYQHIVRIDGYVDHSYCEFNRPSSGVNGPDTQIGGGASDN